MAKRDLSKKEMRNFIIENRSQGKPDQEIYFELRKSSNERYQIAKLITNTATDVAVSKHKNVRIILIALLLISIPVFLNIIYIYSSQPYWPEVSMCAIYTVGVLYYSYQLYLAYSGEVWSMSISIPMMFGLSTAQIEDTMLLVIWLSFLLIVGLLLFYLKNKMFPKNKFMEKLVKNDDGEYVL